MNRIIFVFCLLMCGAVNGAVQNTPLTTYPANGTTPQVGQGPVLVAPGVWGFGQSGGGGGGSNGIAQVIQAAFVNGVVTIQSTNITATCGFAVTPILTSAGNIFVSVTNIIPGGYGVNGAATFVSSYSSDSSTIIVSIIGPGGGGGSGSQTNGDFANVYVGSNSYVSKTNFASVVVVSNLLITSNNILFANADPSAVADSTVPISNTLVAAAFQAPFNPSGQSNQEPVYLPTSSIAYALTNTLTLANGYSSELYGDSMWGSTIKWINNLGTLPAFTLSNQTYLYFHDFNLMAATPLATAFNLTHGGGTISVSSQIQSFHRVTAQSSNGYLGNGWTISLGDGNGQNNLLLDTCSALNYTSNGIACYNPNALDVEIYNGTFVGAHSGTNLLGQYGAYFPAGGAHIMDSYFNGNTNGVLYVGAAGGSDPTTLEDSIEEGEPTLYNSEWYAWLPGIVSIDKNRFTSDFLGTEVLTNSGILASHGKQGLFTVHNAYFQTRNGNLGQSSANLTYGPGTNLPGTYFNVINLSPFSTGWDLDDYIIDGTSTTNFFDLVNHYAGQFPMESHGGFFISSNSLGQMYMAPYADYQRFPSGNKYQYGNLQETGNITLLPMSPPQCFSTNVPGGSGSIGTKYFGYCFTAISGSGESTAGVSWTNTNSSATLSPTYFNQISSVGSYFPPGEVIAVYRTNAPVGFTGGLGFIGLLNCVTPTYGIVPTFNDVGQTAGVSPCGNSMPPTNNTTGFLAGSVMGNNIWSIGNSNGFYNQINQFFGPATGCNSNSGTGNTALGWGSQLFNLSGSGNTSVGAFSQTSNYVGGFNTALGENAGIGENGQLNITIGWQVNNTGLQTNTNGVFIAALPATATESGVIRIGTAGTHSNAYIAGIINGNGAGLTNTSASSFSPGSASPSSAVTNYTLGFGTQANPSNTVQTITANTNVYFTAVQGGPGLQSYWITNSGAAGTVLQIGFPTNIMLVSSNLSNGSLLTVPNGSNYCFFTYTNAAGTGAYLSFNKLTAANSFGDIIASIATCANP